MTVQVRLASYDPAQSVNPSAFGSSISSGKGITYLDYFVRHDLPLWQRVMAGAALPLAIPLLMTGCSSSQTASGDAASQDENLLDNANDQQGSNNEHLRQPELKTALCENDPHVGEPCKKNNEGCETTGTYACDPIDKKLTCNAPAPPSPEAELCDGLDNDCNGEIDDHIREIPSRLCYSGVGICEDEGLEYKICLGAEGWSDNYSACDAVPAEAGEEVCDQEDNNCDGTVDNTDGNILNWEEPVGELAWSSDGQLISSTFPFSFPTSAVDIHELSSERVTRIEVGTKSCLFPQELVNDVLIGPAHWSLTGENLVVGATLLCVERTPMGTSFHRSFSLYLLDPHAGDSRYLTEGRLPIWSGNGRQVAFTAAEGNLLVNRDQGDLNTVDIETGEERNLLVAEEGHRLHARDWSSNGEFLIFEDISDDEAALKRYDLESEEVEELMSISSSNDIRFPSVQISPSDEAIAFSVIPNTTSSLFLSDQDGLSEVILENEFDERIDLNGIRFVSWSDSGQWLYISGGYFYNIESQETRLDEMDTRYHHVLPQVRRMLSTRTRVPSLKDLPCFVE